MENTGRAVEIDPTLTMYYEDNYFGPPWREPEVVMLVHGAAESSRAWFAWVPALARDFRVLRPDLRGFGRSTVPPPGYPWSAPGFAADLARFLDLMGVATAHVVGAKLGAAVALQFAADYPRRTRSLSVLSAPLRPGAPGGTADPGISSIRMREIGLKPWAAETQRARIGSDASAEQIAWWTDFMGETSLQVLAEVTSVAGKLDFSAVLPRIEAPTLVVTTERSAQGTVATVRGWQEQIANSRLLVRPGDSFHVAAAKPDETAQHVLAFIKEHSEGR